ncbi:hypothetical protein FOVSG1_010059 [Fusarium oxysporum f. sp. vasinfectum]
MPDLWISFIVDIAIGGTTMSDILAKVQLLLLLLQYSIFYLEFLLRSVALETLFTPEPAFRDHRKSPKRRLHYTFIIDPCPLYEMSYSRESLEELGHEAHLPYYEQALSTTNGHWSRHFSSG